ncbi:unnamed protein product [Strongylus vulgaris]|uniref:Uncharacterized protein n=1 Tax=Strongylus vulgaris TaxID=40348 RepID=A0A3P7M2W7_STRVU|nr:unnamed protein product [Strongylus vulgaris]
MPNPTQIAGKCNGVTNFLECAEDDLDISCGELAVTLLKASVQELGCIEESADRQAILNQANSTAMLTEQFRRDYPKMPEIAFVEDSNSTLPTSRFFRAFLYSLTETE